MLQRELLQLAQQPLLALADVPTSARAPAASTVMPSRPPCSATQRGRSLAFSACSCAMSPPADFTAATSFAGTLKRPSSRAKNVTVVRSGMSFISGVSAASTSASFQRSTPSTIRNRRPIANVIALSARPTVSGVDGVALEDLDATAARLGLRERAQPRAALGDPAVVVAVDEVGGLEGGHRRHSSHGARRLYAPPMDRATAAETLRRLHAAQGDFYAGGDAAPLRALLADDIEWHVPGSSPIAGDYAGPEAVMDYFAPPPRPRRADVPHGAR